MTCSPAQLAPITLGLACPLLCHPHPPCHIPVNTNIIQKHTSVLSPFTLMSNVRITDGADSLSVLSDFDSLSPWPALIRPDYDLQADTQGH